MKDFELTYRRFSDCSILVQWPQKIEESILRDILIFKNHLFNSNIESLVQINTAYTSILIYYNSTIDNINDEILVLKYHYSKRKSINSQEKCCWKIPVCYDEKFGVDLELLSKENKLSKSEIIRLHSRAIYTVFFIGFLPGFLYLGGLDKRLFYPRKTQPDFSVEKGAVGIGNQQTGIYPNSSPAGWNIIGNSPLNFFDAEASDPCFAKPGDNIQFVSISLEEHTYIKKAILNETYNLETCSWND